MVRAHCQQYIFLPDSRHEVPHKIREGYCHRSYCAGLYHCKERPAIKESVLFAKRLLQINILPSRFREHTAQLAIAYRRGNGNNPGKRPDSNEPSATANTTCHISAHPENTGPDHGTSYKQNAIKQGKGAAKAGGIFQKYLT